MPSCLGHLESRDVAGLLAELDADQVDGLAGAAVLLGVAAFDQRAQGRALPGALDDLELEQIDVAVAAQGEIDPTRGGGVLH